MPIKKIAVLSLVLIVLGALAFFVQGPGRRHPVREQASVFPGLEPSEVQTIVVEKTGEVLTIPRQGEGWNVVAGDGRSYKADGPAVDKVLEDLANLLEESVVSTNVDKRALFGLDGEEGLTVRLEGGAGVLHFVVGRGGPDLFTGYFLRGGEEKVLLVSANLRGTFDRTLSGWRDRTILTLERDDVTALTVRGEEEFTVERSAGGGWESGGRAVDPKAVEGYLDSLINLRASDFADDGDQAPAGLDDPYAVVTLTVGDKSLAVTVGALKEEARQRYLRTGDGETVYLVSQYAAEELRKKEADFPPPPPPPIPAGGEQ